MSLHSITCGSQPMTSFASDSEATTMQTRLGVYRKINMKNIKMMIINKRNNANFSGKGFVYKNLKRSNYFLFHWLEIHLAPQAISQSHRTICPFLVSLSCEFLQPLQYYTKKVLCDAFFDKIRKHYAITFHEITNTLDGHSRNKKNRLR